MEFLTNEKLTIVGAAGMIGSNMAQTAMMMKLTPNICLYDPFAPALEGVAEELYHCGFEGVNLTYTSDIKEALTGASYIVSSGGAARKAGMTREDLLKGNAEIAAQFGKDVRQYCPNVKHIVVIFNPADITGLITLLYSGLKPSQVSTLAALDSTRLQNELVKYFHIPASEIQNCRTYGMYFVIRMKDINSNGILSSYDLPDSEFDTHIRTTLTRRHTKETLGNPNTYTILQPSTDFDFLDENCMYYDIEFRIVRVRLDNGTYICIATNLSEEFPLEEINKLYLMRWSEETSFRELKYTIGLINWHSSKYDGILQEINARMILYNFCELVTSHAVVKTSKNTKHVYKINFATAVNICRAYLKHGGDETETMLLIQKYLTPVRYNRKYPIHLSPKRNRDFMYRVA